jgi:hypothetical protein
VADAVIEAAERVNESVWLIESMGVTPPYKISRFHRESR